MELLLLIKAENLRKRHRRSYRKMPLRERLVGHMLLQLLTQLERGYDQTKGDMSLALECLRLLTEVKYHNNFSRFGISIKIYGYKYNDPI